MSAACLSTDTPSYHHPYDAKIEPVARRRYGTTLICDEVRPGGRHLRIRCRGLQGFLLSRKKGKHVTAALGAPLFLLSLKEPANLTPT